jgi:hypothetical protein
MVIQERASVVRETRAMTFGWLVFYMEKGKAEFLGLYQTKEKADAEVIRGVNPKDWQVASVPFIGWGYVAPGVFGQNGAPPLKVVE